MADPMVKQCSFCNMYFDEKFDLCGGCFPDGIPDITKDSKGNIIVIGSGSKTIRPVSKWRGP